MKVSGYLLVVNGEVFEQNTVNKGLARYNGVSVMKLYKLLTDAETDADAIQDNSNGGNDIEIYDVEFEIPEPKPTEIKGKATKVDLIKLKNQKEQV